MTAFMVELRAWGDTYYRTVVTLDEPVTNPEQIVSRELRQLADSRGFGFEVQRLETMDDIRRFLDQYPTVAT